MPTNIKQFRINIEKLKPLAAEKAVALQKKIALQALRGVVLRSPVKSGRFRGNWLVTVSAPTSVTFRIVDPSGQATIARGTRVIEKIKGLGTLFISNALPYANALEQGSSKQAPAGMVRVTVASIRAQFKV